jgi:DinB superfamily
MTNVISAARAYTEKILGALGDRDPFQVLREMPTVLRQRVTGLSADELSRTEAPGKWSVRHVVQHLADAELVGAFRFRMVLAHDAPEITAYDQDIWAQQLRYQDADVEAALADFTMLRRANLRLLERATPEDRRRVMRHAERGDESLDLMIRMYAGHDLVHLRQIDRIRTAGKSA